jgi:hypothetical protein
VGLTTLSPSCANSNEIWEPQPPGTLRACSGLYRDCFTPFNFSPQDGGGFQTYDPLNLVLAIYTTHFDIKIFELCLCSVLLY